MIARIARVAALLPLLGAAAHAQDGEVLPAYRAVYEVEYKGRNVGRSEHSLRFDAERGAHVFASHTTVKGLLRLANPNPAIEESAFAVDGASLKPLAYRYEDGSRRGDDNYELAFDWERGVALARAADGEREIALADGVLDRGSLQVQLMLDLEAGRTPGRYRLADEDSVDEYECAASGTEAVRTALGPLDTVVYVQRREGSSRETWLWLAPSLGHLPVRIEQRRDGETRTALVLESVAGLGGR